MKSRIVALVLLFGLGGMLLSGTAMAETNSATATALRSLNKLSTLMDKATMAYQMFKLDFGNPLYSKSLDKTIDRIENIRTDYHQAANEAEMADTLSTLTQEVDTFLKKLTFNEKKIAQGGYESYAVSSQMYDSKAAAHKAIDSLYSGIKKQLDVEVETEVQECRDLATLLQSIASDYIVQSVSMTGNALISGGNKPLDELAKEFSQRLADLNIQSDKVIGLNAKVRQVKAKWAFIKNSLVNFKQNTVPYLVYRYTDRMVDDLLQIAELYETRNAPKIKAPTFGVPGGMPMPTGAPPAPAPAQPAPTQPAPANG